MLVKKKKEETDIYLLKSNLRQAVIDIWIQRTVPNCTNLQREVETHKCGPSVVINVV